MCKQRPRHLGSSGSARFARSRISGKRDCGGGGPSVRPRTPRPAARCAARAPLSPMACRAGGALRLVLLASSILCHHVSPPHNTSQYAWTNFDSHKDKSGIVLVESWPNLLSAQSRFRGHGPCYSAAQLHSTDQLISIDYRLSRRVRPAIRGILLRAQSAWH